MKRIFIIVMITCMIFFHGCIDNENIESETSERDLPLEQINMLNQNISKLSQENEQLKDKMNDQVNLVNILELKLDDAVAIQEVEISELENQVELLLSRIDKLENLMIEKSDSNQSSLFVEKFTGYAALDEEISADLNCDGEEELIYYSLSNFKINGISFTDLMYNKIYNHNPHKEKFVIVDIDIKDNQKEIGLMVEGPSSDYRTYFYSYDGENVYEIGNVPFLIDNIEHQIESQGIIYGHNRLNILQTWFANATWELKSGKIVLVEPELYDVSHDRKHNLLVSLPLYENIGDETSFKTIDPQVISFLQTDNKNWIKLECEDGTSGWFKIESFHLITDLGVYAHQVFDDLSYAD